MASGGGVQLEIKDDLVTMDNGILRVTISKPDGIVTNIEFNGIKNLLEERNSLVDRGYWDVVWSPAGSPGTTGIFERIIGTDFEVITQEEEVVELSFRRTWDPSLAGKLVSLNIDKRFVMLRGSSGFYSYAIYEKLSEWPGFNLPETRIAFKLSKDWFRYMVVADNRQRAMPLPDDRLPPHCQVLDYPEAVLLTNPIEEQFKGEVDDKYQYSCNNEELNVHGWICTDPPTGFWQITPSNEFRSGGLTKQNLTSHVGPTNLAMFYSAHYVGEDTVTRFADGEYWKRVFGPVFMYFNCLPKEDDWHWLWEDAKEQWAVEVESWPYWFPASEDLPSSDQRGTVSGRLLVFDSCISSENMPAMEAYVGLAPPGEPGSWQLESKCYQFWTRADSEGYFCIPNITQGEYNLYAWAPGFVGEYCFENNMSITTGGDYLDLGELVFEPPRCGPTLWEIGFPDRTARKFFIPDPDPKYVNRLYVDHPDRFRQYGLWDRYTDLYPDNDLIYTIGACNYQKDWFFAQVNRRKNDGSYVETTWQIKFKLDNVNPTSKYTLQISLASANVAQLEVRVNNPSVEVEALFSTGQIGKDNSIARHGCHGIYRFYSVAIDGEKLLEGDNTLYLRQANSGKPFIGILYDYIRLEGPPVDE